MLAGARDLTVPMPVLASTSASIASENDGVCIGLYCYFYWSVFEVVLVCI